MTRFRNGATWHRIKDGNFNLINKISKMKANRLIYGSLVLAFMGTSACKNSEMSFPDYEGGSSVYFAYQYPVRTIVLGEDVYNTDADNAHRCAIYSVSGGTYDGISATVDFKVDESLVSKDMYFDEAKTRQVLTMPSNYYNIEGTQLVYSGSQNAHVDVQLTDAFFADPKSVENTYVIPLKMTSQSGAHHILTDKDFVLYCVKFINKYQAIYLRRGVDVVSDGVTTNTFVRHKGVENDEVFDTKSTSLNTISFNVSIINLEGKQMYDMNNNPVVCEIELTFNDNGECTVASKTAGFTASGTGHYGVKTEKLAWGNQDRDGLYLDYTIQAGNYTKMAIKDTLVFQTRGVKSDTFTVY